MGRGAGGAAGAGGGGGKTGHGWWGRGGGGGGGEEEGVVTMNAADVLTEAEVGVRVLTCGRIGLVGFWHGRLTYLSPSQYTHTNNNSVGSSRRCAAAGAAGAAGSSPFSGAPLPLVLPAQAAAGSCGRCRRGRRRGRRRASGVTAGWPCCWCSSGSFTGCWHPSDGWSRIGG